MTRPLTIMNQLIRRFILRPSTVTKTETIFTTEPDWNGVFQFLMNEVSDPANAPELMAVGKQSMQRSKNDRFHTYFLFERYLTNLDQRKYSRHELRTILLKKFPFLQDDPVFFILFIPYIDAKLYIAKTFLEFCLNHTSETFNKSLDKNFIPKRLVQLASMDPTKSEAELFEEFAEISHELFDQVTHTYGIGLAASIFHHSYEMCGCLYKEHEAFSSIIMILPKAIITKEQLHLLTQNQVEALYLEKLEATERLNEALQQEIKERSAAQKKIKEQEILLRSVITSSLDAIVSMNDEGKVVGWNPSAEQIFGFTAEEVYGKELSDLIIPEKFREAHRKGFARFLATKETNVINKGRLELPAIRKDGTEIKVELTITSVLVSGKYMFNGFLRELKNIEQENRLQRAV